MRYSRSLFQFCSIKIAPNIGNANQMQSIKQVIKALANVHLSSVKKTKPRKFISALRRTIMKLSMIVLNIAPKKSEEPSFSENFLKHLIFSLHREVNF